MRRRKRAHVTHPEDDDHVKQLLQWQDAELKRRLQEVQQVIERVEAEAQVITQAARGGT
jgi:hypothetical protein